MKKKNVLLYLFTAISMSAPTIVSAYGRVTEQQIREEKTGFIAFLVYFSPILIVAALSLFLYLNRAHERLKKNVEDRNLTGAHAALDVRNVKDREFMEYIIEG